MPSPSRASSPSVRLEHRVFTAALAVGLLHATDDALLHRQPGVPAEQHLPALAVVAAAAVVAVVGFPRLRPGLRSGLALVAGAVVAGNGAMHVLGVASGSLGGSDLTGLLAAAGGVVLVLLGIAVPFRHRGEAEASRRRLWATRVVAVLTGLVVAQFVVVPVVIALVQTHKFRVDVGDPPSAAYQPVTFSSTDGLELAGWYVPSRNGAAVVVVSSARGDREGSVRHASLLAEHGYGVLVYDARGSGESEGTPNGWGWGWQDDVAGALDFLESQPNVDPERIGGLGLSTGADVLIEAAAEDDRLRAVVGDGATIRSFADLPSRGADAPVTWLMLAAGRLFSGTSPGDPLRDLVARAAPTPILLVAAGSLAGELTVNERYADAGSSTTLWRLPDVQHTRAISERAEEYERRVVGHFDAALLR